MENFVHQDASQKMNALNYREIYITDNVSYAKKELFSMDSNAFLSVIKIKYGTYKVNNVYAYLLQLELSLTVIFAQQIQPQINYKDNVFVILAMFGTIGNLHVLNLLVQ